MPPPRQRGLIPGWFLIALLAGSSLLSLFARENDVRENGLEIVPYSHFETWLAEGKIARSDVRRRRGVDEAKEELRDIVEFLRPPPNCWPMKAWTVKTSPGPGR